MNNPKLKVRRLTEIECERLQGFPDGWTDVGSTDKKGVYHPATATKRYKALGNSIAIPFWFHLLKRISAEIGKNATMGSLFSGIGGFDVCWEYINGKGSVRWSSEIEEFPITVMKQHFGDEDTGQEGDWESYFEKFKESKE